VTPGPRALGDGSVDQGDPGKLQAAEIDVLNQEGRVLLIAGTDLRQAVGTFTDKLLDGQPPTACDNNNAFLGYRDAFIDGAKPDLE
jgi:hypothetical protein